MPVNYKQLAERMEADAFHRGCDMSVLVEDYPDERFWECLIESVKPELKGKIDFPVSLDPKGTRGTSVSEKYKEFVKSNFIICVDSDIEYLYDENAWYRNNFIFDTIVYSKENFQCHHVTLNEICKDLTSKTYDFQSLFQGISKSIVDVFYFWLFFKKEGRVGYLNNKILGEILDFKGIDFDQIGDEDKIIATIKQRANNVLDSLKVKMNKKWEWYENAIQYDIPEIKQSLNQQSIREEDILLFCYGHAVMNNFVEPFMDKVIELLKEQKIEEVKEKLGSASGENLQNTISRIENISQQNMQTKLTDSFKYLIYNSQYCKEMEAIKEKLQSQLS